MARIDNSYSFSINSDDVKVLGCHPKSGLPTISIQGECTSPDGDTYAFVATNNLDLRYADRFKVNWNGSKARMPEVVGFGIADDVKTGTKVSEDLYFTRGARIAIARKCLSEVPRWMQEAKAAAPTEEDAS